MANRRACLWRDVKTISQKPPKIQTANSKAICWGGMTSLNVKTIAKLSHGVFAVVSTTVCKVGNSEYVYSIK